MKGIYRFFNLHFHFGIPFELIGKGCFFPPPDQPSLLLRLSIRTDMWTLVTTIFKTPALIPMASSRVFPLRKVFFVITDTMVCSLCAG